MGPNANIKPHYDSNKLTDEHRKLLVSLPFEDLIFRQLFDFMEGLMGSYRCDEPLEYTKSFLASNGIQLEDHLDFFKQHQVILDYEILTVLEPKFPIDLNEFKRRAL